MSPDDKIKLISRNTVEVLTPDDLDKLISSGTKIRHYIGFEISGLVHLGTGLMCMGKIADFLKAGVECTVFLADWHSYINDKLGGDWDNIKKASLGYFKEGLIASLKCFGAPTGKVKFVLGSELYKNSSEWETLMEVSKSTTLSRIKRSITILGRKEGDTIDFAKLIYPPLQVSDIFTLQVNLVHAGIDQRSAHVIARQVAKKLKINPLKDNKGHNIAPIAVHHPLLLGLLKPPVWPIPTDNEEMKLSLKMSKSKPDSAIWIHDSPEEIIRKVEKAFCPPDSVEFNPIINWVKHLVFWGENQGEFKVKKPAKFGGNKTYLSFEQLCQDFQNGSLHPQDLKTAVVDWLILKLEPARKHFADEKPAEALKFLEKLL
jgi:tyrosyl-tRNA synthetase